MTEHGEVLSPRFYECDAEGQSRLRSEFAGAQERGALIAFGAELRDRMDAIFQHGCLYFSAFEDPMSDSCCSVYGEAFMACQGLGIPVVFYTNEMEWADGYGLYARFLGIRKDLVSFGCSMGSTLPLGSSYAERLKGLRSLQYYQFHTWCKFHLSLSFSDDLQLLKEICDVCSTIYFSIGEPVLSCLGSGDAAVKAFSDFLTGVQDLERTTGVQFCIGADTRAVLHSRGLCSDVLEQYFPDLAPLPFTSYGKRVEAYDIAEVVEEVVTSTRDAALRIRAEADHQKEDAYVK